MQQTNEGYRGFAIVELLGHQRYAGYVREVSQYGQAMLRLDIPKAEAYHIPADPVTSDTDPGWLVTQFIGGGAIYRITPTTEDIARKVAAHNTPEPVRLWELQPPRSVEPVAYEVVPGPSDWSEQDAEADPEDPNF